MKSKLTFGLGLLTAIFALPAFAQVTALTYQGVLSGASSTANGSYDFSFQLFDAATGGASQGGPLTTNGVSVVNGLFTVTMDFGAGPFSSGAPRWLQIAVRTNGGGGFDPITTRQALTATPYAITAGKIIGPVDSAGLVGNYSNAVNFGNAANTFNGAFAGSGVNVSNVNAVTLNGLPSASFWKTNGSIGLNPTNGAFLGTADNLPLEIKVNGTRALRIEPNATSPNLVGGSSANVVSNGVVGAFIGGGGQVFYENRAENDFATVVGGLDNIASGYASTAMGAGAIASGDWSTAIGVDTRAFGFGSTVMGSDSVASGDYSTAMSDGTTASGDWSTAMGDSTTASGVASTAMGEFTTASGDRSTAMGFRAWATNEGTFVWADSSSTAPFTSTANNQFLIRATGGVGIGTAAPASELHVLSSNNCEVSIQCGVAGGHRWALQSTSPASGGLTSSSFEIIDHTAAFVRVIVATNGFVGIGTTAPSERLHVLGNILASGTITGSSDRNVKEHFDPINPREVLDRVASLPISRWNYKTETAVTHLGPMAQDFYSAFAVGMDDKHISMVDADGVALAAIQGLNQKLDEKDSRIRQLEKRMEKLEQLLNRNPNCGHE